MKAGELEAGMGMEVDGTGLGSEKKHTRKSMKA